MAQSIEKIKICIVLPGHWSHVMGGAQYQAACLIDVLITSGQFDIYYVTRNVESSFKPDGYKIINIRNSYRAQNRGYLFLDTLPLLKTLHEIKPDVIYTRIGCAYTGIAAYYAKRSHCKLVWHISSDKNTIPHEIHLSRSMLPDYIDRKIFEYGISHTTHIIAQTHTQAKQLKSNYGRDVTEIIGNFHPTPKEIISKGSAIKVVWIANLKPVKQPEIFIQLAKDFGYTTNLEFIMIGAMQGSSRWKANITNQIQSAENLKYLGFTPQEKVNAILAESHILVNTSKWEGFTNTFIQAWMRKVPAVSLNVNPDNIFDNQKLGFIAGNYNLLRKYTETLVLNGELRHIMGEYAYQYAHQHHSEENAQKILSLFKHSISNTEM
jgi:glycosyltransferase involved in cell wall biosynthesis